MDFLNRVLGVRVVYKKDDVEHLPNYIHARYQVRRVSLDGIDAVFMYAENGIEDVGALKKHMARVKETVGLPVVLVVSNLTHRKKEYMLRDHIPFIVEEKQIYLPFMATYLQERGDAELQEYENILPSSQMLLLCYIYRGCGEMPASEAVSRLELTPTSISRATRQLEKMGLIQTKRRGVSKVLCCDLAPEDLFQKAKDYLENPVKRTIFVPQTDSLDNLLLGGYSALAEHSMINPPAVTTFSTGSISKWEAYSSRTLLYGDEQCEIELWRYDPKKLSHNRTVDPLSLVLSLRDNGDERVEDAVEKMLKSLWGDIDGKRD